MQIGSLLENSAPQRQAVRPFDVCLARPKVCFTDIVRPHSAQLMIDTSVSQCCKVLPCWIFGSALQYRSNVSYHSHETSVTKSIFFLPFYCHRYNVTFLNQLTNWLTNYLHLSSIATCEQYFRSTWLRAQKWNNKPAMSVQRTALVTCQCHSLLSFLFSYPELKAQQTLHAHPANCICIKFDPTNK